MLELGLKRRVLFLAVLICTLAFFTGCSPNSTASTKDATETNDIKSAESAEEVFDFYNRIKMGMTKAEVDSALGVTPTEPASGIFNYKDKNGYGVSVSMTPIYSADGTTETVGAKYVLGYETYLIHIPANERIADEKAAQVVEGMTYDQVKSLLGSDGIELQSGLTFDGIPTAVRYWMKQEPTSFVNATFSPADGAGKVTSVGNY